MADYTAHNSRVFKIGLRKQSKSKIEPELLAMLRNVAQKLVGIIDGNFVMPDGTTQFPVDTANLHDATGVGVYVDGRLDAFMPTQRATKAQSDGGTKGIFGSEWLQAALTSASSEFASGIWIVLFSTVPYAVKINTSGSKIGRGVGFFDTLGDNLLTEIITNLKPITA